MFPLLFAFLIAVMYSIQVMRANSCVFALSDWYFFLALPYRLFSLTGTYPRPFGVKQRSSTFWIYWRSPPFPHIWHCPTLGERVISSSPILSLPIFSPVTCYLVLYLSVQRSKWAFPIRQLISQVDISCRGRKICLSLIPSSAGE